MSYLPTRVGRDWISHCVPIGCCVELWNAISEDPLSRPEAVTEGQCAPAQHWWRSPLHLGELIQKDVSQLPASLSHPVQWSLEVRPPFQYPIRLLIGRSREVPKSRELYLELSDRSEIWQTPQEHCCRCASQISKRCHNLSYQSCGFETSQDPTIRRLIGYWNRGQNSWAGTPCLDQRTGDTLNRTWGSSLATRLRLHIWDLDRK